jgi:hypothetical protein
MVNEPNKFRHFKDLMKKRITRWAAVLSVVVALGVVGWVAMRPVVVVTRQAKLPVGYEGAPIQRLRFSVEAAAVGGSRGQLIAMDQQNTNYALGIRGRDTATLAAQEFVVVTPEKGNSTVVPLQKNKSKGVNRTRRPESDAFAVSPSGQGWWTVMDYWPNRVVTLYRVDGRVAQQWSTASGLGCIGAVGDDTLYVIDESNSLWIYKVGQKTPKQVDFSIRSFGGLINWQGNITELEFREGKDTVILTTRSLLDISESQRERSWPQFELPRAASGLVFWHDPADGTYLSRRTDGTSGGGSSGVALAASYSVHNVSHRGEVRTLMNIPTADLAEPGDKAIFCQFLKADGDTAFAAIIRSSATGSRRIHFIALQSVPRWRSWLSR